MRFACLLAIVVLLGGAWTLTAHGAAELAAPTPAALIDLHSIFGGGNENEPDENETDEGGPAPGRQADKPPDHSPRVSVPVALLGVALGALAALFVANRVRRLRAWVRGWSVLRR
jgi:hypothetical protein